MPRSQKIRLDLTGDARRGFEELARSIDGAQKKVSEFSQTTISGDRLKGLEREFNRQDQKNQIRQRQSQQQQVQQQREGAQIQSAVSGATGAAIGGRPAQLGGAGVGGLGQMLTRGGLGIAGGALGGAAVAIKAIGAAASSFTSSAEQMGQMVALGGRFDLSVTDVQTDVIRAAEQAGLKQDQVRRIATIVSAQTGDIVPTEMLTELATMSRAFGMNAESVAQFVAQQERFGTGVQLRKTLTEGIRSGMQVGQLPEYLQGIQSMQEQMVRAGITQQIDFHAVTRELGALGDAWKGKYGVERVMGMTQAFRAASRGEGGTGANIMYAAISRQFPKMNYYQMVEQMERGASDTDNLKAVRTYIQTLTDNVDAQARLLQGVFSDFTFTQSKDFMRGYQENRPAVKRQTAELTVEKQVAGYRDSAMRDRLQADVRSEQMSEDLKKTAADVVDGVSTAVSDYGDRVAEDMAIFMRGLTGWERAAYGRVAGMGTDVRKGMIAAAEAGVPIDETIAMVIAAIREVNKGDARVNREERRAAAQLLVTRLDKIADHTRKTGSTKLPRQ